MIAIRTCREWIKTIHIDIRQYVLVGGGDYTKKHAKHEKAEHIDICTYVSMWLKVD